MQNCACQPQHSLASFITSLFGFISIPARLCSYISPDTAYGYSNFKIMKPSTWVVHMISILQPRDFSNSAHSPGILLFSRALLLAVLFSIRHVFDPSANATHRLHVFCAVCRDSGGLGLCRSTGNLGGLVNGCARGIGAHRHRLCEAV